MKEKRLFFMKKIWNTKKKFINKFYFFTYLFSCRFETNFKKWCDSNKSRFIFLGKRFSTTWTFPIFENKFFNGWNYKKTIFQNKIFINKLLYLIIINSISKIGNGHIVENLFPKKNKPWFIRTTSFLKNWPETIRK